MRLSIGCEIDYEVFDNATLIFNVEAMHGGRQRILNERIVVTPPFVTEQFTANDTGNRFRRLTASGGALKLRYDAQIVLDPVLANPADIGEVPVAQLPPETLGFLNPSRYCPSDLLARFASRQFGDVEPGFVRVTEICNWIHEEVDYLAGSSDTSTTAADTFATRAGVCRDFAHLGVTFCRALGIPARFVSCYAWQLQPQDFHAVFEAYLGDRWYLFDPTRMAALDGLVRIGSGRDAADTAFATLFGNVQSRGVRVWADALDADTDEPWTVDAVSVAELS
ncbi:MULTISPECIES: transglutaminase family protein [unclassified Devosia]|uniref:transglutaminase-like domain-containing protein n=1 Tax=unclassified Devosia TaxID=196773 RepID=UPI000FD968D3|nr:MULTISPECIES: transglutaminase family protein [unclassified Devosia]